MKVSPFFILLTIVGYAQARTRRHLSVIKGDESDASMSYASTLHAAKGSSSRSKSSPTAAPISNPPPPTPLEKCDVCPPNDDGDFTIVLDAGCRGFLACQAGEFVQSAVCPAGTLASLGENGSPRNEDGSLRCQPESDVTCNCEPPPPTLVSMLLIGYCI